MPSQERRVRQWCINLGLFVASLILALGLAEGSCRVYCAFVPTTVTSLYQLRVSRPLPYQKADYFSRSFLQESFSQPGGWKTDPSFGWIPNDYQGKYFNVSDGKRRTTDAPDPAQVKGRVLVFGGSTIYCSEVPDAMTVCSYLQRILNQSGQGHFKVENFGATTVTLKQQLARLKLEPIGKGDVVVFYDGDNDVILSIFYNQPDGTIVDESRKQLEGLGSLQRTLFKIHRRLAPYSSFIAVLLNPIKPAQLSKQIEPSVLEAAARQYRESMLEAADYCRLKGAKFVHFLQPCLLISGRKSAYETNLVENGWITPPGVARAFELGYPVLRRAGQEAAEQGVANFDLSNCLDSRTEEVYLDSYHVNHVGNQMIAHAISERLFRF
ncbi:MAG: SGNH/GDSL hydrolase family protein [Verrucomicrobiales bacterium]|nr:SGNH/GDSL hydrolase family protein [Verrucomicrobiales bacterium]